MKRIYVDMDGVLVDFNSAFKRDIALNPKQVFPQSRVGFFSELQPLEGAIESFKMLQKDFDMWICTRPSIQNLNSYTEKAYWLRQNLGEKILEKTVMICNKSLIIGDYLIDDQTEFGQTEFKGQLIRFGSVEFPNWKHVTKYLYERAKIHA